MFDGLSHVYCNQTRRKNPKVYKRFKPNGHSNPYRFNKLSSVLGFYIVRCLFFHFCSHTIFCWQTSDAAASDQCLHCLPLSIKKDARLIWVNTNMLFPLKILKRFSCLFDSIFYVPVNNFFSYVTYMGTSLPGLNQY